MAGLSITLWACAAALFLAAPAAAFDLPPRAMAALAQGRPYVDVQPDPDGSSGLIRAAIDVPAPVTVIWTVMTDCDLAPKLVADLKSCRVLEADPAGAWDVREYISRMTFLPPVRNVFRSDYEPERRIRFRRTAGDLAVFDGEWRLEPQAAGAVRVFYESRVTAPFHVPGPLARIALRREVPTALLALRRASVARAP
ncbi:polyketide cyclase [Phenylobacterium hankyongense]|uniref:Polyketide cyclase n=1 Tax=Phenylobacterium hankyongense TaxID=1813876 RepID=A0A328AX50_9CAUL|nr:SRPBCC family protein [Phenylobacterium hankyongense]RAK59553.1 polyketide cyclase [Phenylobacterium hankyongense]